jgi:hypothetical protein
MRHEAGEGCEAPDAEHHYIPFLARGDGQPAEHLSALHFRRTSLAEQLEGLQVAATVRRYEAGHGDHLLAG